ncbi:hypothetical protein Tco_1229321 [Tanacetum coccineum]
MRLKHPGLSLNLIATSSSNFTNPSEKLNGNFTVFSLYVAFIVKVFTVFAANVFSVFSLCVDLIGKIFTMFVADVILVYSFLMVGFGCADPSGRFVCVMELENSQNNALAKLPMLKLGEYEMWEIRIKQYFQIQDYALWEVIDNGNSWVPIPVTATETWLGELHNLLDKVVSVGTAPGPNVNTITNGDGMQRMRTF